MEIIYITKKVGLELNTDETEYMLLSSLQNAGQNNDLKTAQRPFENVTHFICLETTIVSNQN
jgi:hypothetical protein